MKLVFKNIYWGNYLFFIVVILLFMMSLLSGCGTKGNLYIPEKQHLNTSVSPSNKTTDIK